jgi:hypothetical protein
LLAKKYRLYLDRTGKQEALGIDRRPPAEPGDEQKKPIGSGSSAVDFPDLSIGHNSLTRRFSFNFSDNG